MKLSSVIRLSLVLAQASTCASFTPYKSYTFMHGFVQIDRHQLFMSDDQPSDSSVETAVDIESEPFEPTENEAMVTSIIDQMPQSVLGEMSDETRSTINESILKLEAMNPTDAPASSDLVNGVWSLKYSGGYSSEWALPSPTRQLALFLYSGGYSPGLFALSLAETLPENLIEIGDLEICISREQPRIEASVPVKFLAGPDNDVVVKAQLEAVSGVRLKETYEVVSILDRTIDVPEQLRYSRDLYITYLDDDLLVVRDGSGVPEILVRK